MTNVKKCAPPLLLLLFVVAAFCLVWCRMPFGVEVTDEALSIADPYLVTQGAVPYADLWSQTPLTSLLLAPLVALFTSFTGGTEGVVLYMFRAAVVVRFGIAALAWLLLRRTMGTYPAAACALLLFLSNMGGVRPLNYNILSMYLLFLAGILLYRGSRQAHAGKAALWYAAAGVVMALCAMAHALQIGNCVLLAAAVLVLDRRRWKRLPLWLVYTLGGLLTAAVTLLGLELASGGTLFSGLIKMLPVNNYFRVEPFSMEYQLSSLIGLLRLPLRHWLPALVLLFLLVLAVQALRRKSLRQALRQALLLSTLGASCCYLLFMTTVRENISSNGYAALPLFLLAPVYLALLPAEQRKEYSRLFWFVWLPGLTSMGLLLINATNPIDYRCYALTGGALLSIPFTLSALKSGFGPDSPGRLHLRQLSFLLPYLSAFLFAAALVTNLYTVAYRESSLSEMTYRVESGVYRGCYTSADRGQRIETLEKHIRTLTGPDDSILISDLLPTAYLMTDAQYCTPYAWDPNLYSYGFQDMHLFEAYFDQVGQVPDKIFFVVKDTASLAIDDPENQFAAYVKANYTLTAQEGEGLFSFRMFTRNPA